ncbi:hypothetical protein [endosymbiont of Ridgeia piscesae]|nr:hypothetical protein [endosymbiont of Ridgeia piscesae]KRT59334.1 hypothetical protein Ga0076813_15293 [endosymbiont of Ridgeia piscesae]
MWPRIEGYAMNADAVFWGSIISVVICVVIIIFLGFKVSALIKGDAEKHK